MSKKIYNATIIGLCLLSFVLIIAVSVIVNNYNTLLEANEELNTVIDKQRESNEKLNKEWETKYNEVLEDYGEVLKENYELKIGSIPTYTREEVELLARCVQAEAGDYCSHKNSQQYITQVILNRVVSSEYPNSIKDVIYDKKHGVQFSVAYNGMIDSVELEQETLTNVYKVLVHGTDLPSNVLFFYSDKVTKNWVNTLNTYTVLEGTVFAYE